MPVTLRQLQLFLALTEHGSVSAVALKHHVTQPTVSMQLRELAQSVGLPLYEIIGKRIHITEAGLELQRSARCMFDEWSAFSERVAQMQGHARGQLKIAIVSTAKYFAPRLLGSYCKQYPGIDIALEVLNRDGVVQRLRDNRDDLYIMSMPPNDIDIKCEVFMANELVVIAPSSHALAKRTSIALIDIAGEHFILREAGSGTRRAADAHFALKLFKPTIRMELGSNEAIKQSVAAEMGISVLSSHALSGDLSTQGLTQLAVESFPVRANWFIVTLKGKRHSPSAQAFLEHLRAHIMESLPAVA